MNSFGQSPVDELLELARKDPSNFDWSLEYVEKVSYQFLYEFKHLIDWKYASMNLDFTVPQLRGFGDSISWKHFWKNNSFTGLSLIDLVEEFHADVDWTALSQSRRLTTEMLDQYENDLDWFWVIHKSENNAWALTDDYRNKVSSVAQSEKYIGSGIDEELNSWILRYGEQYYLKPNFNYWQPRDWTHLSKSGKLSEKFYERFKMQLQWHYCDVTNLSEEFLDRNQDLVVWFNVGHRTNFSEDFKRKYHDKLNCYQIYFSYDDGGTAFTTVSGKDLEERKSTISAKHKIISVLPNEYAKSVAR